ncbi:hypothetical protein RZS08_34610, partial [Arthrospira platensis SPKY1]|nr:hypothetical protein [Arthrospira platensis SPKY1]
MLTQEASRHQVSGQLRIRIEIILKASKGASNSALTREYSPKNHHMAKKWRDRWADKQEALHEMEELLQGQRAMKKRLLEAML